MIISVETEEAFDKFQHIHEKTVGKKRNKKNLFNVIKGTYQKSLTYHHT